MSDQGERGAAADDVVELGGRRLTLEDLAYLNRVTTVGQVLPNVAHELNNALQVVGGLVEMLAARVDLPGDVHDKLGRIAGQAGRATAMIRELVVFARRDDGGVRVVDLAKLVEATLSMRRYHLSRARIGVTVKGGESGLLARIDGHYVQQVLLNLVINAEHSTAGREGAHIDVVIGRVGDEATVTVVDNGPGFAPGARERATDPFFTTKGEHGTGLGLSTAYTLVAALGGELSLDSAPGRGTTVSIALPLADGLPEAPAAGSPPRSAATTRLAVLLVEDAPAVRLMTATMLRALGHDVTAAASPRDALLHDLGAFDLVVSDVEMPGMSGPEMVEEMRARRPGLAVVYTSGYSSDSQSEQRRVAAGAPFVMKPFTPDELAHGIEQALSHASG